MDDQPPDPTRRALDQLGAAGRSRVLASLTRRFGDLGLAEDAFHDALVEALDHWPASGVPRAPEAWLRTVAARKALDAVRRDSVLAQKLARLHIEDARTPLPVHARDPQDASITDASPLTSVLRDHLAPMDDRLVLLYTCAHPALREEDRVALLLRHIAGLTTAEVAHALLLPVSTLQQRLVRAKKRIDTLGITFTPPAPDEVPARTAGVLRVLSLLFAEGSARSSGGSHIRDDLTREAIHLARTLHALFPQSAETTGLLALLLLTEARRPARTDARGLPVPLVEQDRSRWDAALVAEGLSLAERAAGSPGAGTYAIQAAIAAVHGEAPTAQETDWAQIAVLYRLLEARDPGPVVRVGRAVALGRVHGPAIGIRLLDSLADDPGLVRFRPFHIARALTLEEAGDPVRAAAAYRVALSLPGNSAEDVFLSTALATLDSP